MAAHRVRAPTAAIAAIGSHRCSQPRKLRLLLQQRHDRRAAPNAYCVLSPAPRALAIPRSDRTTRAISNQVESLDG
jgi:hypothetical protein